MILEGEAVSVLRGERLVLDEVGFRVEAGEALLLRGPNGAGKSTLLRVMAGLLRPVAGTVVWDGVSVFADPPGHAGRVGFLGHQDAIKPGLDCVENLRFAARVAGRDGAAVSDALGRVGLGAMAGLPARLLSSGQKRRLAIARLLLSRGTLWLMDEPTTGLDDASVRVLGGLVAAHRAGGGAVVASTHLDLPVAGARVLALGAAR